MVFIKYFYAPLNYFNFVDKIIFYCNIKIFFLGGKKAWSGNEIEQIKLSKASYLKDITENI